MTDIIETDMTPEEEDVAKAAEYTLRLMDAEEERTFEARLTGDRELERKVAEWVFQLAPLSEEYDPKKPPKSVKRSLMIDLFGEPEKVPLLARVWPWKTFTVLASACAAVLGVMLLLQPGAPAPVQTTTDPQPLFAGDIIADDNSLRVLAVYDVGAGELRLTRTAGASADGRDFELWAIAGSNDPRSLGVLNDDGSSTITLPQDLRRTLADVVLAISDEPDGGSPFGAPTGMVLATGQVQEL